ncbi:hypothetical protein [Aulosira sp. FACHB-615]|uniref:hypothetical protein n=1 Tax=Aulosira sp. FACHB-615 TaxID=2692777 RepID=UPI001689E61E|nr:hypothetical protein [Aulosira sp. FACHB-615]MBD2491709.1 hypothetical protein [Aulosira sp. FACHB-615]
MEPTISIPPGWQYPRFGFGQRTEVGQVIGLKYYEEDTYLANEYGAGWRYILLLDKHGEDEEHRTEDEIKLLSPQELKATLEAEINNHQRQIQSLKHQLDAIPAIVLAANSTVVETTQASYPSLHDLVDAGKFILKKIAKHPDYLTLEYQPDLTIGDADTALSYLEVELEPPENSR